MEIDELSLFLLCQALLDGTASEESLQDETGVRMVALFDHEEVGSNSAQGAGSPVMLDAFSRITSSLSAYDSKVISNLFLFYNRQSMISLFICSSLVTMSRVGQQNCGMCVCKLVLSLSMVYSNEHSLSKNYMIFVTRIS